MYEARVLKQIAEETAEKISKAEWKDMRDYADNILAEKLHARAKMGQDVYRIELNKLPCNAMLLKNYLCEYGYKTVIDLLTNMLIISW